MSAAVVVWDSDDYNEEAKKQLENLRIPDLF